MWLAAYLSLCLVSGAVLLFVYDLWLLLALGGIALVMLLVDMALVRSRMEKSVLGEFLGLCALTLTAPGAYYVLAGEMTGDTLLLWALNLLFFTSGLFYVKMRVSRFVGRSDVEWNLLSCTLYHLVLLSSLVLLVTIEILPPVVILAYVPAVGRAAWGMKVEGGKINMRRLGYTEVGLTILFVLTLPLALQGNLGLGH